MSERTSYPHGTFSWSELVTGDTDAAKGFYSSLFGWSYDDMPAGEGMTYSMAGLGGLHTAAMYSSAEQPPHWNCYVTVDSVDDAAERAGASLVQGPFDVMDAGRMAVVADPAGAELFLWEARANPGAQLVNQPGAMTWNDLVTPDPDGAERFYGDLFGWTFEAVPDATGYRVIRNGGRNNGGIMPLAAEMAGTPPSWMPYFGHEDVDRLAGEIGGLGGQVVTGPMSVLAGRIAVLGDPQGAVFALWTGPYD